jgi:hypothetical protein
MGATRCGGQVGGWLLRPPSGRDVWRAGASAAAIWHGCLCTVSHAHTCQRLGGRAGEGVDQLDDGGQRPVADLRHTQPRSRGGDRGGGGCPAPTKLPPTPPQYAAAQHPCARWTWDMQLQRPCQPPAPAGHSTATRWCQTCATGQRGAGEARVDRRGRFPPCEPPYRHHRMMAPCPVPPAGRRAHGWTADCCRCVVPVHVRPPGWRARAAEPAGDPGVAGSVHA